MQVQEKRLREYIVNVLRRNDKLIEFIYHDNRDKFSAMNSDIERINFTSDNLEECLLAIVEEMFDDLPPSEEYSRRFYRIAALLVYCIKIDNFCRRDKNYKTDLLVDVLVNVLTRIDFVMPASDFTVYRKSQCAIPLMFISVSLLVFYYCFSKI